MWITGDNTASPARIRDGAPCFGPLTAPPFPTHAMALTPQDVSRIAQLARLELQPAEQAAMLSQ